MNKIILISFLILYSILSALDITGFVFNENDQPIENVVASTNKKAVVTGKTGRFILKDISESDLVTFHKIGYQDVEIEAGEIPSKLILRTAVITIEGTSVTAKINREKLLESPDKIVIKVNENQQITTDELLRNVGLQISGTKLSGEGQHVSIPGFEARHTLVMLDGIPLNKSGEAFDLSSIPTSIIESIEVVKGSSTSQTGSGALGGIININTRRSNRKVSLATAQYFGSFGMNKTSFSASGMNSKIDAGINLTHSFSRNDFKYMPRTEWNLAENVLKREYNDKEVFDLGLNFGYNSDSFHTNYKLIYQNYFKKLPGTIQNLDWFLNSRIFGSTQRHFLQTSKYFSDYKIDTDLFYSVENSTYDNTRLIPPYNTELLMTKAENLQKMRGAKSTVKYTTDQFLFNWGGDYRYESFQYNEKLHPEQSISKKILKNYAMFANSRLQRSFLFYDLSLSGSIRWDRTNRFDDFTSWHIASNVTNKSTIQFSFGGKVGNGFTYPSFMSIYWKGDSQVTGNPDLIPEEVLSWQMYSKLGSTKNFLKFTYRKDKIDHKIVWFMEHNGKWKPDNVSEAEISTCELEGKFDLFEFMQIGGIYSSVSALDKTKNSDFYGNKIIHVPDFTLNCNMKTFYKNFTGIVSYHVTGEQWTTRDQLVEEKKLSSYDLMNVSVNYKYSWKNWRILPAFNARNIFDKMYEIYDYVPQPGFNWEASLSVKWEI
jgi:vitamin B12 transporter